MEIQKRTHMDTGTTNVQKTVSDARLKMVEHIVSQYQQDAGTYVRQIHNETKVGGRSQPNVIQMIKTVFTET